MDRIPVFYSPNMVASDNVGSSPSAGKPAEVVLSWAAAGFPTEQREPLPATVEEFALAHELAHVEDVLACRKANGFGNHLSSVARSLPSTTGSMLTAARHVLAASVPVAASPTSGFHHAGWDSCEGFCTFNGLMVTVLALRKERPPLRVGILDIDEHYGNGTEEIIQLHQVPGVPHWTFGAQDYSRGDGDRFLAELPNVVRGFAGCDLVLYQAGADPHTDDPYGRGVLSTAQLHERDRIVFAGLRDLGVPVVWNLAGGYQRPLRKVLDIHDNTMRACVEAYLETPLAEGCPG